MKNFNINSSVFGMVSMLARISFGLMWK